MRMDFLSLKDNLLKGSAILFVSSMVGNIANYLFQFFMSRHLSIEDFGTMNSLLSLMVITAVPAMAILLLSTKYVSMFKANKELEKIRVFQKKILVNLAKYGFIALVFMLFITPLTANYLHITSLLPVIILVLLIFFSFLAPVNFGIAQGLQLFFPMGVWGSLCACLKLLLGIILVLAGLNLNGAMTAIFFSVIALFIMPFYYFRKLPRTDVILDDLGIGIKKIVTDSMPVVLSTLCIMILTNMDLILVKHYFAAEDAGIYASVSVLGRTIFYLPGVIAMAMFPIVSESHALENNTHHLLVKSILITMLIAGPGLILFFLFPKQLLSMLFGNTFGQGAFLLRFFSVAMFFMALNNIFANFCLAIEKRFFIIVLLSGCIAEFLLIHFFHQSLIVVIYIITALSFLVCIVLICHTFVIMAEKKAVSSKSILQLKKSAIT